MAPLLDVLGHSPALLVRVLGGFLLLGTVLLLGRALFAWSLRGAPAPLGLRLAGTAVGTAWVLTAAFHVLATSGRFDLLGAAVLALLGVAVQLVTPARPAAGLLHDAAVAGRWMRLVLRRRPALAIVPGIALLLAVRALILPPLAWDSLTYHLVKAATWVQTGDAALWNAPGGWSAYRSFSGGGEALWAWTMLPLHEDLLVGLADVVVWLGLGAAVYLLCRQLHARPGQAWTAAAFVAATPAALLAAGSAYVDNLGHVLSILGLVFLLRALARGGPAWLVPAGMSLGLAAGVKFTNVPLLGLVAGVAVLLLLRRGAARTPTVRSALLGLVLGAAVYLPWPVRATLETGHPFSPYTIRVAGVTLGENAAFAAYLRQDRGRPYQLDLEWGALVRMFHSPLANGLGGFPVVPVLLAPVGLLALRRRDPAAFLLVAAVLLHAVAVYWSPQFSVTRLGWAAANGRYFLNTLALATCLGFLAAGPRAGAYQWFLCGAIVFNLWVYGALGWGAHEVGLILGHLALLAVVAGLAWRGRPRGTAPRLALAAVAAALLVAHAALWRQAGRYELMAKGMVTHVVPKYWLAAARAVDSPREPFRIAVTSGPHAQADNWFTYPFLGARLQNAAFFVPPSRTGEVLAQDDPRYLAEADRAAWLERLGRTGADAVMSFPPAGPELGWMESEPRLFTRVIGDGATWGLYALARRGGP